jgi:hypothetical protein
MRVASEGSSIRNTAQILPNREWDGVALAVEASTGGHFHPKHHSNPP